MKLSRVLLLGLVMFGLMVSMAPLSTPAQAADPVSLPVFDPTGAYEVSVLHAARLADLNGKTICELSDYNWEWQATFPVIRELLQKQFPTITIVPWDQMNLNSRTEMEDLARVTKMVTEKKCHGVIIGNAG